MAGSGIKSDEFCKGSFVRKIGISPGVLLGGYLGSVIPAKRSLVGIEVTWISSL